MKKILIPFDGSRPAIRAVLYVFKLKLFLSEFKVVILNVQPEPLLFNKYASPDMVKKIRCAANRESEKIFMKLTQRLNEEDISYDLVEAIGEPADVVAKTVKSYGCDTVVMGTRGMGNIGNLLLGSVATKIVSVSPVPVILVK